MGDDAHAPMAANVSATTRAVALWGAFVACQLASQATHYCAPLIPWSFAWAAARWLLAASVVVGMWILVRRRFRGGTVVLVVLGTLAGQYQTLRWLSALAVWRWRGFAP